MSSLDYNSLVEDDHGGSESSDDSDTVTDGGVTELVAGSRQPHATQRASASTSTTTTRIHPVAVVKIFETVDAAVTSALHMIAASAVTVGRLSTWFSSCFVRCRHAFRR